MCGRKITCMYPQKAQNLYSHSAPKVRNVKEQKSPIWEILLLPNSLRDAVCLKRKLRALP